MLLFTFLEYFWNFRRPSFQFLFLHVCFLYTCTQNFNGLCIFEAFLKSNRGEYCVYVVATLCKTFSFSQLFYVSLTREYSQVYSNSFSQYKYIAMPCRNLLTIHFPNIKLITWTLKRSSRPEVFCEKGVLKNFTKFTGKYLCWSLLFNKVAGLRPATLLKGDSNTGSFLCILWTF